MDIHKLGRLRGWAGLRQAAMVAASGGALWLLHQKLAEVDPHAVLALAGHFSPGVWINAALFTAISLVAVGGYDVAVARVLALPITRGQAFSTGWKATAIAQTLGFGLFTGALVRWRFLSRYGDASLWNASKITALVTTCFFGGWAVVASITALLAPDLPARLWWLGLLGLWGTACFAALCLRGTQVAGLTLPPLRMSAQVVVLTAIDTLAAAAVIYVFLPEGYAPFLMFYAAFMVAFAVGMISTVPGGVGPFELCLVSLLAPVDPTPLLAACLGYRAVYYLAPALLAGVALVLPRRAVWVATAPVEPPATKVPHRAALTCQGQLAQIEAGGAIALGQQTSNSEIVLFEPEGDAREFLRKLDRKAKERFRSVLLYKCSGATAAAARGLGYQAHRLASEAILDPQTFTPDGSARAGLRRKLRKAAASGITVTEGPPGWRQLCEIDSAWQARNGAPLGFSMGRLSRPLLARQRIFTAYLGGKPVAFISFHPGSERWTLDLMRSTEAAPDGTMHALVAQALERARANKVETLSLCSVPFYLTDPPKTWVEHAVVGIYTRYAPSKGLYRFKSSFAPDWQAQFIASPSNLGLLIGAYEVHQLIHAPPPSAEDSREIQDHYDLYEFASNPVPWQTGT